jgi:hypothetical protein
MSNDLPDKGCTEDGIGEEAIDFDDPADDETMDVDDPAGDETMDLEEPDIASPPDSRGSETTPLNLGADVMDFDNTTGDGNMDLEEPGIANPPDNQGPESTMPLNLEAGCVWDEEDYSCAFDSTFMVFYTIYGQSNDAWRAIWRHESPEWNIPLATRFDVLLRTTATGENSSAEYSKLFSDYRNDFRDQVTKSNSTLFPRGTGFAPVGAILERLLGQSNKEPSAYQNLECRNCKTSKDNAHFSLSYLGFSANTNRLRHTTDPAILPLKLVLTRFLERYTTQPFKSYQVCLSCKAQLHVSSLHIPNTSWIWFELTEDEQSVLPSIDISDHVPATQRTHTLQAIIYLGRSHFTARMRKGPSTWWKYDGKWKFGKPKLETIATEEELRQFDTRLPAYLIYRRCEADD